MADKGWKKGLWFDIHSSARNSGGAELCVTSFSVEKGHQIGCEIHQCHQKHGNNKKEFDSLLDHDFATNLKDKSLVNDGRNQWTGGQKMAKVTRTCSPIDPKHFVNFA